MKALRSAASSQELTADADRPPCKFDVQRSKLYRYRWVCNKVGSPHVKQTRRTARRLVAFGGTMIRAFQAYCLCIALLAGCVTNLAQTQAPAADHWVDYASGD